MKIQNRRLIDHVLTWFKNTYALDVISERRLKRLSDALYRSDSDEILSCDDYRLLNEVFIEAQNNSNEVICGTDYNETDLLDVINELSIGNYLERK